jgi:hypothetical protein
MLMVITFTLKSGSSKVRLAPFLCFPALYWLCNISKQGRRVEQCRRALWPFVQEPVLFHPFITIIRVALKKCLGICSTHRGGAP